MIFDLAAIAGGILLAISTLDRWDGDKDFFKKAGNFLTPYKTVIGLILLILGTIYLLQKGCLISDLIGICGGLLLLADMVGRVPGVGKHLDKASKALMPFEVGIGLVLLVLGVTNLFGLGLLC